MCDCETGYVIDFIACTDATTEITEHCELSISGAVSQTQMQHTREWVTHLWIDNWYSSPHLFQFLHENQTNTRGTERRNLLLNAFQ